MGGCAGAVKAAAVFIDGAMATATKGAAATTPLKAAVPYILTTEGSFSRDAKNGSGTYHFANGDRFESQFRNGKRNGPGTLYRSNGERYIGNYQEDRKAGQGSYYFLNGDRYEGN
jgi:hypothetical protein